MTFHSKLVSTRKASAVVLAQPWLVSDRGAEVVLREMLKMFPDAPVACLFKARDFNPPWLDGRQILQSPLSKIPRIERFYREMLPLHPWAVRRLAIPAGVRLVLSSDAAMIKGVPLPVGCRQVCYCHSPPRYLWDQRRNYQLSNSPLGWLRNRILDASVLYCRKFDVASGDNVHKFISNSDFVAQRILGVYGREATTIYPPVGVSDFETKSTWTDRFLIVGHLVPYKRVDLAIAAFNELTLPLDVIGEGPEADKLRKMAGPTIRFLGRLPRAQVITAMESCRAFIYPQVEDFGITAVEAQAAGRPVIALRAGGAVETVRDGHTGVFFNDQTVEALMAAVRRFENMQSQFDPRVCRRNAEKFGPAEFRVRLGAFLEAALPAGFGAEESWQPSMERR